jgi:ABC-type uncharacterized transport system permease subunit
MLRNVGNRDRISRALLGVALLGFAVSGVFNTTLSAVLGIVGLVALGTAIVGFCPAYSLLRMSTAGKGKRGG